MSDRRPGGILYGTITGVLIVFGFLTGFSIGLPFLLLGLALAALAPFRGRGRVFWPGLAAALGFILGFGLITPLGCTSTATMREIGRRPAIAEQGHTTCTNALGITYEGGAAYNPPRDRALIAGLALAGLAAGIAGLLVRPPKGHG